MVTGVEIEQNGERTLQKFDKYIISAGIDSVGICKYLHLDMPL